MTQPSTQDLLKKINYIETDVEIHKQILFSIPSKNTAEIEKTIKKIASKNQEIELLRQELKKNDPAEFAKIIRLENAVAEFKNLAKEKPFHSVVSRNMNEACSLLMQDGSRVECLIKACSDDGWTVISLEGELRQFPAAAVAEKTADE